MGKKIIIVGPAYPYRGGIAAFSQRLAVSLQQCGNTVQMLTFTLQYPSFLFPGKTQFSTSSAPEDLNITRKINAIGPLSWLKSASWINAQKPDLVIFAVWSPAMSPALGTIARLCKYPAMGLIHNLLPHERHFYDPPAARYMLSSFGRCICLSAAVRDQVNSLRPDLECAVSPHPLYDSFGQPADKMAARRAIGQKEDGNLLLFFGLIREYKGLDLLLEAYAKSSRRGSLLVAGEFYEDPEKYHAQARLLGIDQKVIWHSEYIEDSRVADYFNAADLVVQPYKSATQSGVTQIAYQFEKPMLVTRVGGLAEIVPHRVAGYVVSPDSESIKAALEEYWDSKPDFSAGVKACKKKYSWETFTKTVLG